MFLSRNRGAALRGFLIGCLAATATTAALIAGPVPASGAVPPPGSAAVAAPVLGAAAAGAADTTRPSEPGMLGATNIYLNTALGLVWTPSTDDTGVTGYEVYTWTYTSPESVTFARGPLQIVSSTPERVTGYTYDLVPGRHYLAYVVAVDAAGNRSVPSLLARGIAMAEPPSPGPTPGPVIPPTPTDLRAGGGLGADYATLTWTGGTDSTSGLVWQVFRRSSTEWNYAGYSSLPRTMVRIGTEPSYTFQVVTRNAAGYLSLPSNAATYSPAPQSPTPTPTPTPTPPTCSVTYEVTTWASGFAANVTVKNIGTTDIDGWRLAFDFPSAAQHLTQGWSAAWAQSGTGVTAASLSWNKTIKPGKSQLIGLIGTHTSANPSPAAFTVNGRPCTTG